MKKHMVILLVATVLLVSFAACDNGTNGGSSLDSDGAVSEMNTMITPDHTTEVDTADTSQEDVPVDVEIVSKDLSAENAESGESDVFEEPPPQGYEEYSFNSVEEMIEFLEKNGLMEKFFSSRSPNEIETSFQTSSDATQAKGGGSAVPCLDGRMMEFRNREGYPNVHTTTKELYDLSWTWYYCKYNNHDVTIKLSDLQSSDYSQIDGSKTYLEVLAIIAPTAPNPSNYHQKEGYESIYERQITLDNNLTLVAMISELEDSNEVYVMMHLDHMLVILNGDEAAFTTEFFSAFSIAESASKATNSTNGETTEIYRPIAETQSPVSAVTEATTNP